MQRQTLATIFSVAMLLFASKEGLMSQTKYQEKVRNVVLVHGAWVDGSGWQGVYDALKKSGYEVTIVQNTTASLADDVAATEACDCCAQRSGHSCRPLVRWRCHHRSRQ